MPIALVQGSIAIQYVHLLRKNLPLHWEILTWDPEQDSPDLFLEKAMEADVIIGGKIPLQSWPKLPKLKMFQIPWTGYDFCSPQTMPQGIPVCNCYEHETTIAEYVMLAMLEWQIRLSRMDRRIREKGWDGRQVGKGLYHGEIRGKTLGILGYGHIGREIAKRASAFEMRILGIRRKEESKPEFLDWLGTPERLPELLEQSDFLVVCCDLNSKTEGMLGKKELESMKKEAVLINVARGRVVDEQALYQVLLDQKIGGAIIDVWYNYIGADKKEVWPSNYPFQDLENVILSAHESAWTREQIERRWKFIAGNLERVEQNLPPENLVFYGEQPLGM